MGRRSMKKMRKVRIVKGKPVVNLPWWLGKDSKEYKKAKKEYLEYKNQFVKESVAI